MKKAQKQQVQENCEQLLQIHFGAVPAQGKTFNISEGYWIIDTPIGKARLRLDVICKSKIMTLSVNFYEQIAIAKKILGHWKQNLHSEQTEHFPHHIEQHLTGIFDKIKESDAWMYMHCIDVFKKCYGLQLSLSSGSEDAVTELSKQTLFSEKWIRENIDTIKRLETEEKEIF